ncbi:hypothetical protein OH77DRAFT_511049 [Trametes cingulata]|nr:hypothetical protein OH77DRAFT_511049 [Trametes cingulata]
MGVCRAWHALARSAPLLWRDIHVRQDPQPQLFELFLARASGTPLQVTFNRTDTDLATLLDSLHGATYLARLEALTFESITNQRHQPEKILHFLSMRMLTLDRLRISFNIQGPERGNNASALDFEACPDQCRHLKYLSLSSVVLRNPHVFASTLVILELRACTSADMSLTAFLAFLQECSNLEELTIAGYRHLDPDISDWLTSGSNPLPIIALPPQFRALAVEDIGSYTARLLSGLRLPRTASVSVIKLVSRGPPYDAIVDETYPVRLRKALPPDMSHLPLPNRGDEISVRRIALDNPGYALEVVLGSQRLRFGIQQRVGLYLEPGLCVDGLGEDLHELFGKASVTSLDLGDLRPHVKELQDPVASWKRVLASLPRLRSLVIVTHSTHLGRFYWLNWRDLRGLPSALAAFVCPPMEGPEGAVLCPDLEQLCFSVLWSCMDDTKAAMDISAGLLRRVVRGSPLRKICIGFQVFSSPERRWEVDSREVWWVERLAPYAAVVEVTYEW